MVRTHLLPLGIFMRTFCAEFAGTTLGVKMREGEEVRE
jgi:hypothetical protein